MIELDDVWKSYGGKAVLRGVTAKVQRGEALAVIGRGASGKSTLVRLLLGFEAPDLGRVAILGHGLERLRSGSLPYVRRNFGVVTQECRLVADRSAIDNVAMGVEVLGVPRQAARHAAAEALALVGFTEAETLAVGELAASDRQKVAVARALAPRPSILLCDEPTARLDDEGAFALLQRFEELRRAGMTLALFSQDQAIAQYGVELGWQVAELKEGVLRQEASAVTVEPPTVEPPTREPDATDIVRLPARRSGVR